MKALLLAALLSLSLSLSASAETVSLPGSPGASIVIATGGQYYRCRTDAPGMRRTISGIATYAPAADRAAKVQFLRPADVLKG